MKILFWKFLLGLVTVFGIAGSTIPVLPKHSTSNKTELKDKNNYVAPIIRKLDFNYSHTGPISSGHIEATKVVMIINYKAYANSWQDFTNKYTKMKFLNYDAQGGGQGTTDRNTAYETSTKGISFTSTTRVLNYAYDWLFVHQMAIIEFSYKDVGGMLTLSANFYTQSANAIYNAWVSLKISDVIFE